MAIYTTGPDSITYSSSSTTSASSITSAPIYTTTVYDAAPTYTISVVNTDEYKKTLEKVDEHIDQLEGDIQFLNDKREAQEKIIANLLARLEEAESKIIDLTDLLDTTKSYAEWVETRLQQVEKRND